MTAAIAIPRQDEVQPRNTCGAHRHQLAVTTQVAVGQHRADQHDRGQEVLDQEGKVQQRHPAHEAEVTDVPRNGPAPELNEVSGQNQRGNHCETDYDARDMASGQIGPDSDRRRHAPLLETRSERRRTSCTCAQARVSAIAVIRAP